MFTQKWKWSLLSLLLQKTKKEKAFGTTWRVNYIIIIFKWTILLILHSVVIFSVISIALCISHTNTKGLSNSIVCKVLYPNLWINNLLIYLFYLWSSFDLLSSSEHIQIYFESQVDHIYGTTLTFFVWGKNYILTKIKKKSYRFGMTWGRVHVDRIFIFE